MMVSVLSCFVCETWPSQLSCLGSSVGRALVWNTEDHRFNPPDSSFFVTVFGELNCTVLSVQPLN